MCPCVCQSCVTTTLRNSGASRLISGMILSPSGTGSVPPGRKQFCTSITASASASPGLSFICALPIAGRPLITSADTVAVRNCRRAIVCMGWTLPRRTIPRPPRPGGPCDLHQPDREQQIRQADGETAGDVGEPVLVEVEPAERD